MTITHPEYNCSCGRVFKTIKGRNIHVRNFPQNCNEEKGPQGRPKNFFQGPVKAGQIELLVEDRHAEDGWCRIGVFENSEEIENQILRYRVGGSQSKYQARFGDDEKKEYLPDTRRPIPTGRKLGR